MGACIELVYKQKARQQKKSRFDRLFFNALYSVLLSMRDNGITCNCIVNANYGILFVKSQ